MALTAGRGAITVINFDDVGNGTVLNTHYAGLTFTNPIGTNIYARDASGFAPSSPNVVSVFQTGLPEFDARWGAVDVYFSVPVRSVSIDARPVLPLEFLGTVSKRPYLQAFDSSGNLLGTYYYQGALPSNPGEIGPTETLTWSDSSGGIARARWSSQQPYGGVPTYGLFDNLRYDDGRYSLYSRSSGGGSVSANPAQSTYSYGTVVTLTAAAIPGWIFVGWSGDTNSTANPIQVTMHADLNVRANFIPHGVNVINFDDVSDGTMINSHYPGLTFTNPLSGNVYARNASGFAPSSPNVASVFATGLPEFDAYYGAVDVYFDVPMRSVSIDARPEAPPEFMTPPSKRPFLQIFDAAGGLLGSFYYLGALPTSPGEIGPVETITGTSGSANIARARFSSQNRASGTPTYGLFDNLAFDAGFYLLNTGVSGGGMLAVSPAQSIYTNGTIAVLKPNPNPGWLFSGWTGDASGSANPLQVTMNADKTITASFGSAVSGLIVDDPSALLSGRWTNASYASAYGGSGQYTSASHSSTLYAKYVPNVQVAGNYDVYVYYPDTQGFGTDHASYLISYNGGQVTEEISQASGGGRWQLLHSGLPFAQGTNGYVQLSCASSQTSRILVADAVRLSWSSQQSMPPITSSAQFGSGSVTLNWNALPGRTYRVQYKNSIVDAAWTDLPGDVTVGTSNWTASKQDITIGTRALRFYRLVLLPF